MGLCESLVLFSVGGEDKRQWRLHFFLQQAECYVLFTACRWFRAVSRVAGRLAAGGSHFNVIDCRGLV